MNTRAVLFTNLGSPDSPDVAAVRRYLEQFLMDPCVIQLPWLLRRLIVSLFVLPTRPARSAHAYRSIWTERGSPLIALSQDLLTEVRQRSNLPIGMAMRYGKPSIEHELLKLAAQPGIREVLLLPLYPHYAESTVLTSVKEAQRVIQAHGLNLNLRVHAPFYAHPDYIAALVDSSRDALAGTFDHVLFSYHGVPELHIKKVDPTGNHCLNASNCCQVPSPAHATCYRHQVYRTTEAFVAQTGLRPGQYSVAFQSRLGRAKWLVPATEQTLHELATNGVKKLLVLCPSFVTDCLETLEEIELQGGATFRAAGGEQLVLVPCLNAQPSWADTLANWIADT